MSDKVKSLKTINEVEEYRKSVNEACDARVSFINLCTKANDASIKQFGYIKESFESISPELFKTAEGKKIMKKYSSVIKENKNLSAMHSLYENIRKANKESDVDFFINNIANTEWGVSKSIKEDTAKLGRILAEGILFVGNKSIELLPEENSSLENAVRFIAENKKTSKNIADYSNAVKVIRENIMKAESDGNLFVESVDLDGLAEKLLKEFNKKYSNELTKEETNALKEISSSENRESVFNKYKESCTTKLSEAKTKFDKEGDTAASDKLSTVLEQVTNKKFSLDTVGSDICSLIELTNIFK